MAGFQYNVIYKIAAQIWLTGGSLPPTTLLKRGEGKGRTRFLQHEAAAAGDGVSAVGREGRGPRGPDPVESLHLC